jgi:hypothetical protein
MCAPCPLPEPFLAVSRCCSPQPRLQGILLSSQEAEEGVYGDPLLERGEQGMEDGGFKFNDRMCSGGLDLQFYSTVQ